MSAMSAKEVMEISPIVPVIALERVEDALPLAKALFDGGIKVMEITLRTKVALECIQTIAKNMPQMHVGAGTVLNESDTRASVAHGAKFLFSPGISQELLESAKDLNIALIPGVGSASEVMFAKNSGFAYCKLFPATVVGGVDALKAYYAPFRTMHFCPTGGVNLANINDFLALPNVKCVGGSWIVPKDIIAKGDFQTITRACKESLAII